jgi:beta-glucosidase
MNDYGFYAMKDTISIEKNYSEDTSTFNKYRKIIYQYATALPIATAIAQSFNTNFARKCGDIVGKEMEIFNINLWLAPGMNIHRNILCGRNFEYFSEDPLVSGKMAAALTLGVQAHKNRGVTIKHFAANNQEFNRLNNNSKMSERALRELYLKGFQIAIEEGHPHALMTSYNLINGVHTSENPQLLVNLLRNEWNFKGLIMTDWSHSYYSDFLSSKYAPQNAYEIIKGGNNIMMPGGDNDYELLITKLNEKILTRDDLLCCASKVYEMIEKLNSK